MELKILYGALKVMVEFFHYWEKQAKNIILFNIYLFKKMIAFKCDFNGWQITKKVIFHDLYFK